MQNETYNPKYHINVDLEQEVNSYDVETKFNDYIGMQKKVLSVLRNEGFLENNVVTNEESGMQIAITAKGIKETLGSGKRFQSLPRDLKRLKLATLRALPEIIKNATLLDNVPNSHGNKPRYAYFYSDAVINDIDVGIKIDVRKSVLTNKFWIHNVQIEKNLEILSPATVQVLNEHQSSDNSISYIEANVISAEKNSVDKDVLEKGYKCFSVYEDIDAYDLKSKTGWNIEYCEKYDMLHGDEWLLVVYRDIEELPEDIQKLLGYQEPREGEYYKCFNYDDYLDLSEAQSYALERGWEVALTGDYDEFTDCSRNWCIVYREVDDLPKNLQTRVLNYMAIVISDYQKVAEISEDKKVDLAKVSKEALQDVFITAKNWFRDYNRGWICDEQGKFVGIKKPEAELIERYERETEIPVEERIINSQNNFQLKDNVSKEQYLKIYDEACTYDRLEQCEKEGLYWEIKSLKFSPTNSLIKGIRQFSRMEGKNYSFREVAELHKTNPDFSDNPKKARCFEDIIKECQEQELAKMKEAITFFKQEMMMEV